MSVKKPILILSLVLALTAVFSGCSLFPSEEEGITPPIRTAGPTASYRTYTVKLGTVVKQDLNKTARVITPVTYDCYFEKKDYRFKEYPFKSGDMVNAGDIVAVADTTGIENNIKDLEYQLKGFELDMQRLKTSGGDPYAIEKLQLDIDYNTGKLLAYREALNGSTLAAPAAGMIYYLDMTLKSGDTIIPNKTLVRITDLSQVYIEYTIEAANAASYKIGMAVVIRQNNKEYAGEIIMTPEALPAGSAETTQKVKIAFREIPPGGGFVSSGLSISIIFDKRDNVIAVPKNYVSVIDKVASVNVLEGDNKVSRTVVTGLDGNQYYEILSGLSVGDVIIVPDL
jgi:multidrug efflux pump subunit AcrA (membrane-fusion protein)